MRKLRGLMIVTAIALAGVLVGASVASAVITARTGTFSEKQIFTHQNAPFQTAAAAYVNVPGAVQFQVVPAGTRRMLDVRFSAESRCLGRSGWCTVRVLLVFPNGALRELDPISGIDFAFDSATETDDAWESHAIERSSPYLAAGTYRILVQTRVVGATSIRLDDWTLASELIRP